MTRKEKACRVRRKREGGLHLVILEQLLRPAFSVLLGENNSIKGTRGSIITEWGDRRQLPAWLWKPFQILKELPHITCCSCWDHLGEMPDLAPTRPSRGQDSRITPVCSLHEFQPYLCHWTFSQPFLYFSFSFQVGLQKIRRQGQFSSLIEKNWLGVGSWSCVLGKWVDEAR